MDTADLTFEQGVLVGFLAVAGILILLFILRPWRKALFCGAPVSLGTIVGMRLRGNPPNFLINAYIELIKGGDNVPIEHIECLYIKDRSKIQSPHHLAELAKEVHQNSNQENG